MRQGTTLPRNFSQFFCAENKSRHYLCIEASILDEAKTRASLTIALAPMHWKWLRMDVVV
jgi:hypothetical protein